MFFSDCDRASAEDQTGGAWEGGGGGGGGGGQGGQQADAVDQEEVQDNILHQTEKRLQDPVIFVTL